MHGVFKSARADDNLVRLGILLSKVDILAYEMPAARLFGRIKADLERTGGFIGDLDLQIACIALTYRVPLVTHNRRH
jgi:predicted nucleic acid-binding protein